MTVAYLVRVFAEQSLLPRIVVRAFDRELQVLAGVGDRAEQVHRAHGHQRQVGAVGRARQTGGGGALHDRERARQPTHVHDIRLHDVDRAHLDHALPGRQIPVLLPAGDVESERVGDLFGLGQLPVGTGFLEMADAFRLEEPADLDRPARRVAAVGIDELRHAVAESARNLRHDRLGAPRPLIDVMAALGGDAPLEGVEALFVAQLHQPARFVGRGDVAAHGGRIGAQAPRLAAEQLDHRLACELAAQIP